MPEGPEVRNAAEDLRTVLEGQVIEEVMLAPPQLRRFETRLQGTRVVRMDTYGKVMLTRFDSGLVLYSHNRLHGRWYVRARGDLPRTNRSLRVALHTHAASALLYSTIDINILDEAGVRAHPFLRRLGPDVLAEGLSWRDIAARLREPRFAEQALAVSYLDQGFLAGIGNYLRSEILFFAGLRPDRRPMDLDDAQIERLARQTLAISKRAYHTRGITNAPSLMNRRKAGGERRRRSYRHAVFDRAGRACEVCGTVIQRVDLAARRLYYCAGCQL